ncbi:MAG TPA: hypothetical protein DDW94_00995 [Deltaproteobacteria bacterium]|nr:MAG: hypothetical protein A2Z79_06360 [Deltaproteobacteria bacterium GWA2_55_82]OGQ63391.1 MAG: hypothetical protein A3I81_03355 [Deltaproteobacteria bacterium RIFCSPLOWO2_02_FULL_55_12]OIJ73195.1 MAG: hypothetical protein A2V21_302300 [Deltaproteobacteria bacterium GWC2_55_46]HBG45547.1 hypothetical protein [Deltaproteobacteria bacterium]HCY10378.1 hypothetical protein [Deltaproteobacteria bacterium]
MAVRLLLAFCLLALMPVPAHCLDAFLDQESMECLGCHNEISVRGALLCHEADCDHPIGVDYALASSGNPALVSIPFLDPSIRLPEGKIGCGTCHTQYKAGEHEADSMTRDGSQPDPLLIIDNTASRLCMACHIK